MSSVRQKCRPKHQQLVLKCYPRAQKNNVEVKANSSELSYLLYYASTRRSKLQKVGDFLDKRMTADVWKGRIGCVNPRFVQRSFFVAEGRIWGIGADRLSPTIRLSD